MISVQKDDQKTILYDAKFESYSLNSREKNKLEIR